MTRQILQRLSSSGLKTGALILILLVSAVLQISQAQQSPPFEGIQIEHPNSDLWRDVRQRGTPNQGTTQVKGVDSDVLINARGDAWARFRMETLIQSGMIALGAVLLILALVYLIKGTVRIDGGYSGNKLLRFNYFQRFAHWSMAILFLALGLTGLILLFGRPMLIPLFGHEAFSWIATVSKVGHNVMGPLFLISLFLMLIGLVRRNMLEKGDLRWLLRGGGLIGKGHLSTGFFNMGEKGWYWVVILVGFLVSVSGLVLLTPFFGQGRLIMELAHVTHTVAALLMIAISFGHMYMGSIGIEGAYEGMKSGYVDYNWAQSHHDRWAKECKDNNLIISAEQYARLSGESAERGATAPTLQKVTE